MPSDVSLRKAPSLSAALAHVKSNAGRYYVYVMRRPDGVAFYVGYGRSGKKPTERIADHERESASPLRGRCNRHKINTIRQAWRAGGEISYEIASWHDNRADAARSERDLIAVLGRADMGAGPLTNLTDGGDGAPNLSGDGRRRWIEGCVKGGAGRREWGRRNPDLQRQRGEAAERYLRQWKADNPEKARETCSVGGKRGGRIAIDRIKLDTEKLAMMQEKAGAVSRSLAKQKPEFFRAMGKIGYAAGLRAWTQNNASQAQLARIRGGRTNAERWRNDPTAHGEQSCRGIAGIRRWKIENPERVREIVRLGAQANVLKAEIRRKCLIMIERHGIRIDCPRGRAGYREWKAFAGRLDEILHVASRS